MHGGGNEFLGKAEWRARLLAARAGVSTRQRVDEARALVAAVGDLPLSATVCCYVPFGSEPGAMGLLDAVRTAGSKVLLPVVPPEPGPLDWAEYTGTASLAAGRLRGVLEPTGARLGADALGDAGLVLVPALAVDRSGIRLGRGAGYYDRSLPRAADGAELVALVRDDELVDRLPGEAHDMKMTAALTPGGGLTRLG
ncbi:5-formyltetrahydrofolate cyclo-ligase [Amycolatopsis sp. CA-230715]|uniref:5-formyltetrahydrofolate cyclo-ligase n=1 Tax=Amycolatopsis sp. CA-230715 TaxID=2745196 RepID=UPI001C01A542|nr:5-formyltetrahydrofolate cyclo-ligase [Amycolatopsis sp. CA-230715]QWF81901.1 5-formyltetrahydrofolate cyclo-ligase [Amycolatopsis sp. CA-230715]